MNRRTTDPKKRRSPPPSRPNPRRRPNPKIKWPRWFIALILVLLAGGWTVVVGMLGALPDLIEAFRRDATATPLATNTPIPQSTLVTGRLEGLLTDRTGNPISDVSISIRNGPETKTDMNGKYVLSEVPAGDQLIVVRPAFGDGQITLNIAINANQTNSVNIVYDAATARLGLLSIVAPIDGGDLEIRQDKVDDQGTSIIVHRATIYGRSDGLAQIFPDGFEIYVLVNSERDGNFWVQRPPAVVDPNANSWRANIVLGDADHPPQPGELWTILAAAVDPKAGFDRIISTPRINLLPPFISSNIATVFATIQ